MTSDSSPWVVLGRQLAAHRIQANLSKRAAAAAAGFSEGTWRQLEAGERNVAPGIVVEMSSRAETVAAAARAVGMDPGTALSLVGLDGSAETLANLREIARQAPEPAQLMQQLVAGIAEELHLLRVEVQRLGDAYEQLASPPPAPPPPGATPPRRGTRAVTGAAL